MSDPEPDPELDAGWQDYREERLAAGIARARAVVERLPQDGRGWYLLACLHERMGALRLADRCFARAARATHEPCAPPCRIDAGRFTAALDAATRRLPPQLAEALGLVQIVVRDHPTPQQLGGFDEFELLGLFDGPTRAELGGSDTRFGPQPIIWIYRRPHEHACINLAELREEVARTFLHEYGHFLGFDEDDMVKFGME